MPDYGNRLYWEERYAADPSQSFDWYFTYETLQPLLAERGLLRRDDDFEVLLPGCGNSTLPARLSADGYSNLSCVDISAVIIGQLKARYAGLGEVDFFQLDVTDAAAVAASLPEQAFDLVLDKALLDAVLCGEDAFAKATSLVASMHRVLKPGGALVVCSFGKPEQRLPFLTSAQSLDVAWDSSREEVIEIPKTSLLKEPPGTAAAHYVYILRRKR